jgi:hypothetical protein
MMNVDSFAHHPIRAQTRKFSIALMPERIEEAGSQSSNVRRTGAECA